VTATVDNLKPAPQGNLRALKHGLYSPRALAAEAEEAADLLMALPHTVEIDRVAAVEIGRLLALIERLDEALAQRGMAQRTLLDARLRASGRLERWLAQFGATPQSRATWAATLAQGRSLAEEIARRRQEANGGS
jgi:hypothetical protein